MSLLAAFSGAVVPGTLFALVDGRVNFDKNGKRVNVVAEAASAGN